MIAKKRYRGFDLITCTVCNRKRVYTSDEEPPSPFICVECGGDIPPKPTSRFQHHSIPSDAGIAKILHPEDQWMAKYMK